MKNSQKLRLLILFLVCFFGVIGFNYGYGAYEYRFKSPVIASTQIKIHPSDTFDKLFDSLENSGTIESSAKCKAHAIDNDIYRIKPGNYKLKEGMSYRQVLTALAYGHQTPVRLTFNNIRTINLLAGALSKYTLADSTAFIKTLTDKKLIDSLGFTKATFPAMFIPNTYEIYWSETPKEIVLRLHKEYKKFWNETRKNKAKKLGLTPNEITTIASIVTEETKVKKEMTTVAGVYINRVRIGIPLQADPTVKFAIGDFGIRRILHKHLKYQSPYNTYTNKGLPPGPIAIPSGTVIDATLNYSEKPHKYLYFCAKASFNGEHAFATNLSQHNQNARAYHKELNRRNIK